MDRSEAEYGRILYDIVHKKYFVILSIYISAIYFVYEEEYFEILKSQLRLYELFQKFTSQRFL